MRSLRVSVQVVLLVILPLALQVCLLAWMSSLQSEAEAQLKVAEHSKLLADGITKLNAEQFETVSKMGHMYQLEAQSPQEIDALIQRTHAEYKVIDDLSKSEPELNRKILSIQRDQMIAFDLAKRIRSTDDEMQRHMLWMQLGHQVQDIMYGRLSELSHKYQQLAKQSTEAQAQARMRFQQVALWGSGITMLITAIIGFALAASISLRLNRLIDNNLRLATNRPLHPEMKGNDEIAKIDHTFHNMADALEEASQKERAVIDYARDLICSISKGKFTDVNPASFALLGYTKDELYGTRVIDAIAEPPEVAQNFVSGLRERNDIPTFEVRMRHKDGQIVDTLWSTQWSEKERSTFCVIHDMSERRAAERLRQELVHMVTHDLRTPLTTLGHIFEILINRKDTETEERKEHYLEVGERSVTRLALLVNDLLDMEKIRSGQMSIDFSPCKLDKNFSVCFDSVAALAESKGITLMLHPTDLIASGDAAKIDRILINLVGNAIKYSPKDGVIDVFASADGEMIKIVVKDQGKGIPADEIEKIFDRFHQVQGTEEKGSSGLGLTICRAFVELHGGRIWAESKVGEGTSFCFTLPWQAPKGAPSSKTAGSAGLPVESLDK
ncbi:MAG: PAS domain S-box protein [Cyanobacteria bacterium SZAS-4]|nr:PAS domain S-box protein [Cyanobacteria bacterium SZAS-4]